MAVWSSTKAGAREFAAAARAGVTYWSVEFEVSGAAHVREWQFARSRLRGLTHGHLTPAGALAQFGPIYDHEPSVEEIDAQRVVECGFSMPFPDMPAAMAKARAA